MTFDKLADAPWNLVGQGWRFFLINPSSLDITTGGYYHPLELEGTKLSAEYHGVFKGGFSSALVYRYSDSDVGPYDELIFVPGKFTNPVDGKEYLRVSRIYVSSERCVYNGRTNWNVPKHLARFKFTLGPSNSTKIEVFSSNDMDDPPFFSAISRPAPWIPSYPFNSLWSPILVQPPLKPLTEEQKRQITQENPETLASGSPRWASITPLMTGKLRVCRFEPGLDGNEYGDGIGFPKIQPWSWGLEWLPGMKLFFPESEEILPESIINKFD